MALPGFSERLRDSAADFIRGVQPILERKLSVRVYPIEDLHFTELSRRLDLSGIDAFYYDQGGDPRTLGSRVMYSDFAATRPAFTFRYALWDARSKTWDTAREFHRKARALSAFRELIVCPKLHVESFSRERASGNISWSFVAECEDLIRYIYFNFDNPEKVRVYEPQSKERRKVIEVSVKKFAREFPVTELTETKT